MKIPEKYLRVLDKGLECLGYFNLASLGAVALFLIFFEAGERFEWLYILMSLALFAIVSAPLLLIGQFIFLRSQWKVMTKATKWRKVISLLMMAWLSLFALGATIVGLSAPRNL
jgi:hypothetical protein